MRTIATPQSVARQQLLKARARWMRHAPTLSEQLLWQALRSKQLGVQFRRQVVLGEYIVDFVASSVGLIVEVDGGYHQERQRLDARREAVLLRAGYRVLRLDAALVTAQLPVAVARIREQLASG